MCTSLGKGHYSYKSWGLLALRVAIGVIFMYTGYQKLGPGHVGAAAMMGGIFGEGLGSTVAYIVGVFEMAGGLMVLLGAYAMYAAAWLSLIMIGAMVTVHRGGPVFGYFLPLAVLGGCLALLGSGAGKFRLVKTECYCRGCQNDKENGGGCGGACGCGDENKGTTMQLK